MSRQNKAWPQSRDLILVWLLCHNLAGRELRDRSNVACQPCISSGWVRTVWVRFCVRFSRAVAETRQLIMGAVVPSG
jgi:hypothetical protein